MSILEVNILFVLQVSDWDDRHKTVHWVNIPRSATSGDGSADKPLPSPAKKKVKTTLVVRVMYTSIHMLSIR